MFLVMLVAVCAGAAYGYLRNPARPDRSGWWGLVTLVLLFACVRLSRGELAVILGAVWKMAILFMLFFGVAAALGTVARRWRGRP